MGQAFIMGWIFGTNDLAEAYRRSALGPIWSAIALAFQITLISLIFGHVLGSDLKEFLPFVAVSFIIWNFISGVLRDAPNVYVSNRPYILQMETHASFPAVRLLTRHSLIFAHNSTIMVGVFLLFPESLRPSGLLALAGVALILANLYWITVLFGILGTRFRDFEQIVTTVLTVSFYVTPIIWLPSSLDGTLFRPFVDLNPVFWLMELVRTPLIGGEAGFMVGLISMFGFLGGLGIARYATGRFWWRVAYWL